MERLTIRNSDGTVSQPTTTTVEQVFYRLAEYEDTGLEPEQVKAMTESAEARLLLWFEARYGYSAGDLMGLLEAKQEGRLVVLPCKTGEVIYGIKPLKKKDGSFVYEMKHGEVVCHKVLPRGTYCVMFAEEQYKYPAQWKHEEFGKTVFLTREEAEAALERMRADG